MIGLLEVIAMAGTLLAVLTWVFVAFLAPGEAAAGSSGEGRSEKLVTPSGARARGWLYATFWVPLALMCAALAAGLMGQLLQGSDHCLQHRGVHHHLCLLHPPHAAEHALTWVIPLVVVLPVAAVLLECARRAWSEWRLASALVALSRPSEHGPEVRMLDQSEPLALTVGWRTPTILLSQGLVDQVSSATLSVILAHERAHVARRDTLKALFDRFAASLLPRPVSGPLLERISLAREQACDEAASQAFGDRLQVAKALTTVMRLRMSAPAIGVSVASGALEARVRFLLEPPRSLERRWPLVPAALVIALVVAGAGPVHSIIEYVIAFLVH